MSGLEPYVTRESPIQATYWALDVELVHVDALDRVEQQLVVVRDGAESVRRNVALIGEGLQAADDADIGVESACGRESG